jgi:hypothetical protein
MGGAPAKKAYLMLVPADETHKEGKTINISESITGTITQIMYVTELNKFDDDDKLKGARPNKKPGTRKVVLGKVGDSVKTYINDTVQAQAITPENPIEVKYENEIELYKASNAPSAANSENISPSTNLFAQENEARKTEEEETQTLARAAQNAANAKKAKNAKNA